MVVGTTSSAGKSLLVAALCRIFARKGMRVAPFKAQNMSNNAAVCPDGSEIGRAQAVQAAAAGIEPTAEMNPILLKPEADTRSQAVVLGRAWRTVPAHVYYREDTEMLWQAVTTSLDHLREQYELVVIEGAGSPVELNLKARDIVNMAVARYAQAPTLLVGDIDRGGVFAQLLGTLWLLEPEERALIKGLVVNKFRGDLTLFTDGIRLLEERGGVPVLGVVPYLHDLGIPEEDAVALDGPAPQAEEGEIDLAVIHLPLISNFDDFDPLAEEPGVHVRYVTTAQELGHPHAVILPGSKSTIADLAWLREQGLAQRIQQFAAEGGAVVGICGGYQMLGQLIRDPDHVESSRDEVSGLGLLPTVTTFRGTKATYRVQARITAHQAWLAALQGQACVGYEIHMGRTEGATPWLEISQRGEEPVAVPDGALTHDGRIWGCYLHGLFENGAFRRAWLQSLGWEAPCLAEHVRSRQEAGFERLADAVEAALDMRLLEGLL